MSELTDRLDGNRRFTFQIDCMDADTFAVVRLDGHEAISRIYRFELVLVSHELAIDMDKMLQGNATLRILPTRPGEPAMPYHGVLAEFDQLRQAGGYTFYRAVLVPRIWRLSLGATSDVYLDEQSVPRIVEGILGKHQLTSDDYILKLKGDYRDRSFVCQYKESDLDFVMRWLEKEGIYFYFEHDGAREKLLLLDDRILQPADTQHVVYRPASEPGTNEADDAVQAFMCQQRPLPAEVVLQDYNPHNARLVLSAPAPVAPQGFGKVVLYGENFRSPEEGARYARIRAQEIACGGRVFTGEATATGLRSGRCMTLASHYRNDFNGEYLITEVSHHGSQAGALLAHLDTPYKDSGRIEYQCTFRAIAADTQFRPARMTSKPTVSGTLNAIIDAEGSGEFAELDEYGQYKVQLAFDYTDKPSGHGSARIRMASPYAGTDHGMHFPLHKNTEVLLAFTDGDPDRPVILGAVPNSDTCNVVTRDTANLNRIATKGGNQMFMSDTPGAESTWLHSPHNGSHVIIGAMAASASGGDASTSSNGLTFVTRGSTNAIQLGGFNKMTFGPTNTLTLGTDVGFSATMSSKMAVGGSSSYSMAREMKWNSAASSSVAIDEGDTTAIKEDAITRAFGKITMSAGVVDQEKEVKGTLDSLRDRTKKAIATVTGINLALGTGMVTTLGAVAKGKDGKFLLEDSNPAAIGTTVADGTGAAVTTAAGLLTVSSVTNQLVGHYEKLKPISELKLDKKGVDLRVNLSGNPKYLGASSLNMRANVTLMSEGLTTATKIELSGDEGATLSHGDDLSLSMNRAPGVPQMIIQAEQQSINANRYKISLESGANSKVVVEPAAIKSTVGVGTCAVTADEVKLETGAASGVSVSPTGIALKFPGGRASYDTGMISINSDGLIKLG